MYLDFMINAIDSDYGAVDEELGCQSLARTREGFENKKIEFLDKLKLNKTDILKLERRTIDQPNNEEWKKERLSRLTASNFGISVDKIYRNDEFWSAKMEISLAKFYLDNLLLEIIDPKFSPDK
ncbi:hypothetical protein QTP88_025217 [Uroleucon formosanum]